MSTSRRPRTRTVLAGAVVSAVLALGVALASGQDADARSGWASDASSTTVSGSSVADSTTAAAEAEDVATIDSERLDAALAALGGHVSVALLNLDTGDSYASDDDRYDTASIVKVDILAALLHQQDGELTAHQKVLAAAMIERSDNDSATALFEAVGGASGLSAFNAEIGLTDTVVGADGSWGLTRTTAADQVRLLQVVLGDGTVLDPSAKAYVAGLMQDVIDAQRFGVSAAADRPDDAALKVGYLQRSATGLWDVTSIGRIVVDGQTYLVAVLSDGSTSLGSGRTLVEAAARAVVSRAAADLSSTGATA